MTLQQRALVLALHSARRAGGVLWLLWGAVVVVINTVDVPVAVMVGLIVTAIVAMLASNLLAEVHEDLPCIRCFERFPVAPDAAAEAHAASLQTFHFLRSRRALRIKLAMLVPWVAGVLLSWPAVSVLGILAWCLMCCVDEFTQARHGQLAPWCPQCRRDGGDDAEAPAPDPVRAGTR